MYCRDPEIVAGISQRNIILLGAARALQRAAILPVGGHVDVLRDVAVPGPEEEDDEEPGAGEEEVDGVPAKRLDDVRHVAVERGRREVVLDGERLEALLRHHHR